MKLTLESGFGSHVSEGRVISRFRSKRAALEETAMRVIGLIFTGVLVGVSWLPTVASAGGTATCAADRPCIVPYMSGTKVIFENRSPNWDAYNIIYPTANGHSQIENSTGNLTVHGVKGHNQVV